MQLELSAEDAAFRDEMRTFFTTQVPQEIRDAVAERRELTKEQIVETQRTLNAAGLAVPHWPVEWGGRGWSPLRRHIWHEEMQRACVPTAARVQRLDGRPGDRGVRHRRSRRSGSCRRPRTSTSGGARASPSPTPAPTSRRCAPPRSATATSTSSTGRRPGPRSGSTATGSSTWSAPTPTSRSRPASRSCSIDMTSPGVTVRPIELIDGGHEVNEVWFEDVRVPAENLVGEENKGWDYAKFLLGNERVGVAPVGCDQAGARAGQGLRAVGDRRAAASRCSTTRSPPPGSPSWRTSCWPSSSPRCASWRTRPTASRTPPRRCSSSRAPSSSRRSASWSSTWPGRRRWPPGAGDDSDLAGWARHATPVYLNLRKASIYGGSNEVQRQIIAKTILGL